METARLQPAELLVAGRRALLTPDESRAADSAPVPDGPLRVGVDPGTALHRDRSWMMPGRRWPASTAWPWWKGTGWSSTFTERSPSSGR
ncbi:MAG TPA: hypothetical protein VMN57_04230 [Anaerolineales bacterium]|nr:hypothetical protein [Anaerolineales bacterium]